jgi:hypothetical protein
VGPRECVGGCGKPPPSQGFDPRTVQLVACRYTDYAIPASIYSSTYLFVVAEILSLHCEVQPRFHVINNV